MTKTSFYVTYGCLLISQKFNQILSNHARCLQNLAQFNFTNCCGMFYFFNVHRLLTIRINELWPYLRI